MVAALFVFIFKGNSSACQPFHIFFILFYLICRIGLFFVLHFDVFAEISWGYYAVKFNGFKCFDM